MEAEIGVRQLQSKDATDCQPPPEATEGQGRIQPGMSEGTSLF